MIRLTLGATAGLIGAAVVAAELGGPLGAGVLAGFLLGAGITGLCAVYQREVLLSRPEKALAAMAISFLVKLAVLLTGALLFRFVDGIAERADWRSFLVAFAAAVLLVLPLGALDAARALKQRSAH